jgi:Predicted peptidase
MNRILLIILYAALSLSVKAGKLTPHVEKVLDAYNFWLYTPDDTPEQEIEPKPLIVFLHGASLCGRDLDRVRRYGTIDAIEKGRTLDAYVIAPQNPGGSWIPRKVMNIVDWVGENHNIDYDRIYVIGMSLGGYGTIDMAATYPDQIAAAMALCGGGTVSDLSGLNDVPLWIVHGIADRAVTIGQSDRVVSAMRSANSATPRLVYDRVPGMNHSQPARFFYLKESYDWLFSHSLKDKDRSVNSTFDPTGLLKTAYKDLKFTGSRKKHTRRTARRSHRRR